MLADARGLDLSRDISGVTLAWVDRESNGLDMDWFAGGTFTLVDVRGSKLSIAPWAGRFISAIPAWKNLEPPFRSEENSACRVASESGILVSVATPRMSTSATAGCGRLRHCSVAEVNSLLENVNFWNTSARLRGTDHCFSRDA